LPLGIYGIFTRRKFFIYRPKIDNNELQSIINQLLKNHTLRLVKINDAIQSIEQMGFHIPVLTGSLNVSFFSLNLSFTNIIITYNTDPPSIVIYSNNVRQEIRTRLHLKEILNNNNVFFSRREPDIYLFNNDEFERMNKTKDFFTKSMIILLSLILPLWIEFFACLLSLNSFNFSNIFIDIWLPIYKIIISILFIPVLTLFYWIYSNFRGEDYIFRRT